MIEDNQINIQQCYNVVFYNESGEVGRIEWGTGKLVFIGNAEESAKIFFEQVLKGAVDSYISERLTNLFNDKDGTV